MENDAPPIDPQPIERRLATILMADVADYSRMMGENEERTVQVFRGHRQVFDELLRVHRGRIFNTAGDAVLAEFPSAVEAVRSATEIQAALRTRNEHLPADQRMWFRIGINLGDVIVQGGDLLGDGVNVAARIQSIAEPGGICISGSVYDQIQNKLTLQFRQLGEQSFKNIAQPIRTFSISGSEGAPLPAVASERRGGRKGWIAVAAAVVVAIALGAGYAMYHARDVRLADEARTAEAQRKTEQEHAAAASSQKEAKLAAELQASKDALAQAEAGKRKAEQDRAATEAAQREARLQAELRSAKEAQQRAEAERKATADEAAHAAAAAKAAEAKAAETRVAAKASPTTASAAGAAAAATDKGAGGHDGTYLGRMCSTAADGSPRCWQVALQVQKGSASGSWISRITNTPAHVQGTIAADGSVSMTADSFKQNGDPLAGKMNGNWADNAITVTGNWSNGFPLSGNWTRAR